MSVFDKLLLVLDKIIKIANVAIINTYENFVLAIKSTYRLTKQNKTIDMCSSFPDPRATIKRLINTDGLHKKDNIKSILILIQSGKYEISM